MAYTAFDLTGKVALVTGGNSGIGLGFAHALAQAGADLAIWGTNPAKNAAAKAHLAGTGRRVETFVCDVGDEVAVDTAFAQTLECLGRVDGCFANAGVMGSGRQPFHEMHTDEWRHVLRVNLDGAFFTFRAATRHMVARGGGGVLVGTASVAALQGAPRYQPYGTTKGGLVTMMQGLAVEFARHGIRANAILPGWIQTDMTEGPFANQRFSDAVLPRIPMRRWGVADDFGGIAVYLMSDAARYHTGDSLVIDGGYRLF